MSEIVQLYTDKNKEIKAYPKTLASQTYMNDGTSTIEEKFNQHINNHPSGGGGSSHEHSNKSVLDGITSSKVSEWDSKANSTHRHNASEIDGLSGGGSFINDLGDLSVGGFLKPTHSDFPSGYGEYFIYGNYNNGFTTTWICFKDGTALPKIALKSDGNIVSQQPVQYKYSANEGMSWSTYTDTIQIKVDMPYSKGIYQANIDLYDGIAYTNILRQKDVKQETEIVSLQMTRGKAIDVNNYIGKDGQLVIDTTNHNIRIMDGTTKGGYIVGGESGESGSYDDSELRGLIQTNTTAINNHINNHPSGNGGSWIGAKSVKDFGAKGDGTTDDTVAIQSAINWSNDNTKTVYFPTGKYKVTQTLYLKDFCSFVGDANTPYGKDIYGPGNVSDVVIQCLALTVFKGYNASESKLHETQLSLKGINFQQGDPTDSNMLNSIFFYKLQLNNSDIRHCLFRGFGIWLMGAMFMLTFVERNIFMEMRKYFIQSLSIPNIGNTACIIDSKVNNNYINGSQSGNDNIAFFINYPAFSEIRGNFIDFWKWGFDIWQGEATSIADNEFQYCSKGIRVSGANSINIHSNRFGKMQYANHKSAFKSDVSKWGTQWHCIDLEDDLTGCVVTNNVGSTVDMLIRMRAINYARTFVNANMSTTGTIVDTQHSNDNAKKVFIQEYR